MATEAAEDGDSILSALAYLSEQQWTSGKEAVDAVKEFAFNHGKRAIVAKKGGTFRRLACDGGPSCPWHVNLSLTRRKEGLNYWHITTSCWNHMNCTGTARPTARQLAASAVLRAAVIADAGASAPTLESQLQIQSQLVCNRSMLYRAKQQILMDVFSDDLQTIELLPNYLAAFASLNPGTFTSLERDSNGHFLRAIVVHWKNQL